MSHWTQPSDPPLACPSFARSAPDPDLTVSISLATPMLGGGARAKHPDIDEPFRPAAVRSGIRWWWRQAKLSYLRLQQADVAEILEDLSKAEVALWGSDSHPGSCRVEVLSRTSAQELRLDAKPRGRGVQDSRDALVQQLDSVAYAWNLLTDSEVANNPHFLPTATGELRIWGRDNFLNLAVQLWLTFGGVGSRTRRGFGVLEHDLLVDFDQIKKFMASKPRSTEWPTQSLQGARLLVSSELRTNAKTAWQDCLRPYSDFRKGNLPNAETRDYDGPNSHSRWPESDAVREAQGLRRVTHDRTPGQQVPKAVLGLPMTLHSANSQTTAFDDDTLEYGQEGSRWPSPVILRPIKQGTGWRACALIMKNPPLDPSDLRWRKANGQGFDLDCLNWPTEWWGQGVFQPWNHGQTNALEALVKYLTGKSGWVAL